MLRAIWFLVKASVLVGAVIWLTRLPPQWIEISGFGYEVEIQATFLFFIVLFVLFVATRLDRLWRTFISVPHYYRRYRHAARREQGYRTVTDGLVAIAAGDAQAAHKHSRRAESMIPDTPLTKLLTAQSALLNGNAPKARREFMDLLEHRSAAFFGVRGLLNETLASGDHKEALSLIRRAEQLQPKRQWISRTLFELETRNHEWLKAERTLRKAEKLGVFDKSAAAQHRQALWMAMSDDAAAGGLDAAALRLAQSALALDPGFTPAALRVATLQEKKGKWRLAVRAIEDAWAKNPHPELGALWNKLMPAPRKAKSLYDAGREAYAWAQRLDSQNPGHREGHRLLGLTALDARLWKEARDHLLQGQDYRALARLEHDETGNEVKAREWLEMAADSPPDPRWICRGCGHAAPEWQALCRHCAHFDSQSWVTPSHDVHQPLKRAATPGGDFLSPPQARA